MATTTTQLYFRGVLPCQQPTLAEYAAEIVHYHCDQYRYQRHSHYTRENSAGKMRRGIEKTLFLLFPKGGQGGLGQSKKSLSEKLRFLVTLASPSSYLSFFLHPHIFCPENFTLKSAWIYDKKGLATKQRKSIFCEKLHTVCLKLCTVYKTTYCV